MNKIAGLLKKDNQILKVLMFLVGVFIIAFVYNLIFVPNNIVVGGMSGLAIVIQKLTGLPTSIFINVSNAILLILSFIFLGKKDTMPQIFGSIVYPVMITLTEPLSKIVSINFESMTLLLIFTSIIYGFSSGIIYRAGYSTGGSDILLHILTKKLKQPITRISPVINNTIIILGGIVFSPIKIMYAVMIIYISNKITNTVLFDTSANKMVYVISKKSKEIENYIMNKINIGATEIRVHSGLFEQKKQMLMCVVHNFQYQKFKHNILNMDPNAFILAKTCYEVNGGQKYNILPF